MDDVIIKNITSKLPKDYKLNRIVAVALDVLIAQLHEHEQAIVEKYGTELLEILHGFKQTDTTIK